MNSRKRNLGVAVIGLAISGIIWLAFFARPIPVVEAQGGGTGVSFSLTFPVSASGSQTIIPACTATTFNPSPPAAPICIPNFQQIAHQVITVYAIPPAYTCGFYIDGSPDNLHFNTLAIGGPAFSNLNTITETISINGYNSFTRLKVLACPEAQTITYTGFNTPLPISLTSMTLTSFVSVMGKIAGFNGPYVLAGFQCSNSASTDAFLQLNFTGTSTPSLGAFEYEILIPPAGALSYSGPPINSWATTSFTTDINFYAGAATTQGGTTAVSTPLDCNFQFNQLGPFYPFYPPSA